MNLTKPFLLIFFLILITTQANASECTHQEVDNDQVVKSEEILSIREAFSKK